MTQEARDPIAVNGDTGYPILECFADDMDAESGEHIIFLEGGVTLVAITQAVEAHRRKHGCGQV